MRRLVGVRRVAQVPRSGGDEGATPGLLQCRAQAGSVPVHTEATMKLAPMPGLLVLRAARAAARATQTLSLGGEPGAPASGTPR